MSEQWQIRRGTTAQNDGFTGAEGEITMDTDKKQLRVHDGSTQGGAGIIDPIVAFQVPTAQNNYTWYRKYRSGWVEQGGHCPGDGVFDGTTTVTLPITMSDANYNAQKTNNWNLSNAANYIVFNIWNKTTTSFSAYLSNQTTSGNGFDWVVKGMAA